MRPLLDAFWRAAAYCLHPKVIGLSVLPLLVVGGVAALLGFFYWHDAVVAMRAAMESWSLLANLLQWLDAVGAGALHSVLAPLVIIAIAVPMVVVLSLLLVAVFMTPAIVNLVAARRFPDLERRHGAGFWRSALSSVGCTVLALVALLVSMPLWLIPPLVLLLPPLIWGWLTYRVMGFDVLADHASATERRAILHGQRGSLLAMGVICGYLGAAPSVVWAFGALTLVFAPVFIVLAVWLYTLVFAFSALWFAHYALAALDELRTRESAAQRPGVVDVIDVTPISAPPAFPSHRIPPP